MIRIAALNDSSDESDNDSSYANSSKAKVTNEAKENAAYALYNKALAYERQGSLTDALKAFDDLLKSEFLSQDIGLSHGEEMVPTQVMKYSALKNISHVYSQLNDNHKAIEALLQAIEIDFTDVSVCYRLGLLAKKINNFLLASRTFTKGLEINPQHWPCLDNLLTILFVLNNYETCLYYIAKSLERDPGYIKGLVLRKRIFEEQPCLLKQSANLFKKCMMDDIIAYTDDLNADEIADVLDEVNDMRWVHKETYQPKPTPTLHLHLSKLSWAAVGERLLEIYASIEQNVPDLHFAIPVSMDMKHEVESSQSSKQMDVTETPSLEETSCSNFKSSPVGSYTASEAEVPSIMVDVDASQTGVAASECASSISFGFCSQEERSNLSADSLQNSANRTLCKDVETLMNDILDRVVTEVDCKADSTPEDNLAIKELLNEIVNKIDLNMHESYSNITTSTDKELLDRNDSPLGEVEGKGVKRKKVHSSSKPHLEKRRSARVKVTVKPEPKKDVAASYLTRLKQYIPENLLQMPVLDDNHCEDNSTTEDSESNRIQRQNSVNLKTWSNEEDLVKDFVRKFQDNYGVTHLMREWLYALCGHREFRWPDDVCKLYKKIFELHRQSFHRPNIFSDDKVEDYAMSTLIWMELKVDDLVESAKQTNKPISLDEGFCREFRYWEMVLNSVDKLPNHCTEFTIRYQWMAAKYHVTILKNSNALQILSNLLEYIQLLKDSNNELCILLLPSCSNDNTISEENIRDHITSLERSASLENVSCLFDSGKYEDVIRLITPTLSIPLNKRASDSRSVQLTLLIKSLSKQPDSTQTLKWLEEILNELVHQPLFTKHSNSDWNKTCILCLNNVISQISVPLTDKIQRSSLVRFVGNILSIIEKLVEQGESPPAVPTVLPWLIVHKIILLEENRTEAISAVGDVPESVRFLLETHDYFGGYGLCTCSDGILLTSIVEHLITALENSTCSYVSIAEFNINQCIYCLYGHPNKKVKAKNFKDHSSKTIPISWAAARVMFKYFKPKSIPEFDSYKFSTISAELEHLLRRIVNVIPSKPDLSVEALVDSFLEAKTSNDDLDKCEPEANSQREVCSEIYYLLADYYLKNKEPLKAVKHYIQDLYYNPRRFDSWAGMALAKSSRLESRINTMEKQMYDGTFQKLSVSTMQCFQRALLINPQNSKLWIEYAASAYQLHSYASRVLKCRTVDLSSTERQSLIQLREEMLKKSGLCYMEASKCDDDAYEEAWLHHYMLGKVSEKSRDSPSVYLNHYITALEHLDKEGAQYPQRISFMYNPPYLAVEALEIYYRIHTAILKDIQQSDTIEQSTLREFSNVINQMNEVPFVQSKLVSSSTLFKKRRSTSDSQDKPSTKRQRSNSIKSKEEKVEEDKRRRSLDKDIVDEVMEQLLSSVESAQQGYAAEINRSQGLFGEINRLMSNMLDKVDVVIDGVAKTERMEVTQVTGPASELTVTGPASELTVTGRASELIVTGSASELTVTGRASELTEEIMNCMTDLLSAVSDNVNSDTKSVQYISAEELAKSCVSALKLCVQRFPLHYKSYHRLAKFYLHDKASKNLDIVQDLLLGNTSKKKDDKFVPQGLFQDRKHNNFFNGVWRIPIEEIERAGSFGAHLFKTIYLLLQFLHEKRDYSLLHQLHTQLQRTPEQEKKFLKDADRLYLASKSMEFAIHSLYKIIGSEETPKDDVKYAAYLHQAYKWFGYCNKHNLCLPNSQVLLIKAYRIYRLVVDPSAELSARVPINEAKQFCQQKFSARGKEKNKTGDGTKASQAKSQATALPMEVESQKILEQTAVTKSQKSSEQTIVNKQSLPSVRGSFQTFECDRANRAKAVPSETVPPKSDPPKSDPPKSVPPKSVPSETKPVVITSQKSDIPESSWLHKAKEGTASLVSMFEKPSSS